MKHLKPQELKEHVARLVALYRKNQGLTQQEVADEVGISRGTLMHIESANQHVSLYQFLILSELLDIPLDKVFKPKVWS